MRIAIVNYGMGNLSSVRRAFEDLGAEPHIWDKPDGLGAADMIVLPGVGAFNEGMSRLRQGGWEQEIQRLVRNEGKPLLGICLGMQMLAEFGDEGGEAAGLGFVSGRVRRLDDLGCQLRIPHVGWNSVTSNPGETLFAHIPQDSDFYFVHSFAIDASDPDQVAGTTMHGMKIVAAVRAGSVSGTQFHPEKSSRAGRQLLRNALETIAC